MLAKKNRLSAHEVRDVLKKGRSVRGATVSVKYLPAPTAKAAIVISAKIIKTAVGRNRMRRAAYAALPSPLPRAHVVFFINKAEPDVSELAKLCSQLS